MKIIINGKKYKTQVIDKNELRDGGLWLKTLKKYNFKCVNCGSVKNVVVHHIDFNSQNNISNNLTVLCRVCHAEAHGIKMSMNNPKFNLIIEMRNQGNTLENVGKYLGISRQRVHQIIRKYNIKTALDS